ncbi:MAG: PAS domain-containing protein [Bacillota bacterium]
MNKIGILIVGADREGHSLYHCFRLKPGVKIAGIVDVSGKGMIEDEAVQNGTFLTCSVNEALMLPDIDVIVETTKLPEVRKEIYRYKRPETQVIEASGLDLLITLGRKKERMEAELLSLLNSVNDAVLMVNNNGNVTYVNKTFTDLTGVAAADIVEKNIFEWCPDSPVARALKNHQPCSGLRSRIPGSTKELLVNATPVLVRGELHGAVGVIRQMPDFIKLMEELKRSTTVIENIYDKLGQINGLSDIYISDIVPIDKMEQLLLQQALEKFGLSVEGKKQAARALNISLATLYNKLKKYKIS